MNYQIKENRFLYQDFVFDFYHLFVFILITY